MEVSTVSTLNAHHTNYLGNATRSIGSRRNLQSGKRGLARKSTLVWRVGILVLLAFTARGSFLFYQKALDVDTDTMLDASVSVKTISHVSTDKVGDTVWKSAAGSGFLISRSGCEVLTNHHVVKDAAHVEVYPREWPNARGISATVVNANPQADIAILRMSKCDDLPQARLGDSGKVSPGDEVYAVGNPLGSNPDSISRGIVSHVQRFNEVGIPYLQTDASITHGNSGGALFNRRGEVVGINTAIFATSSGNNLGIAFALPINFAKRELQQLRTGEPSWGDAGIDDLLTSLTPDEAAMFNVPGGVGAIILNEDPSQGPAVEKLFSKDLIYTINGESVTNVDTARRKINSSRPGDAIRFGVIREGAAIDVEITLIDGWQATDTPKAEYYEGYLGLALEMWEEKRAGRKFDTPVITKVKSLSPSHMAHIASSQKTFVNTGRAIFPVQLDVKTITGVVADGVYSPLSTIEELDKFAQEAYMNRKPLLIEIEVWARKMPMKFSDPLERQRVSFHRVVPELAAEPFPQTISYLNGRNR